MKGEALIIVKDKNGNIKHQIKEKNTVFDIPKELIKDLLANADLGPLGGNGYSQPGNNSVLTVSSPFGTITCYADWFRTIKVNDETCDTSNFKDWKYPVLTGGEYTVQVAENKRYAYLDTIKSQKAGKVLKKYWTWTNTPAFTLRSLNLCHYSNAWPFSYGNSPFITLPTGTGSGNPTYLRNIGKYYFTGCFAKYSNDYFGESYYNDLATRTGFSWDDPSQGTYSYQTEGGEVYDKLQCCSQYMTSGSMIQKTANIIAMNNNELLVFRKSDNMETNDTSQYWEYVKIIDANTGVEKRSFRYNKFTGISFSSGYGVNIYYTTAIATDFGTFLIQSTAYNSGVVSIWKIPETQTDDTIAKYVEINNTDFKPGTNMVVVNEYVIDTYHGKAIRLTNDSENPYIAYNYFPFNYQRLQDGSYQALAYYNKYYKIVQCKMSNFETWYNTTVLNLSSPIEIAAGDTLNIEYTITVN